MRSLILPSRGFATPKRLSRFLFQWEARDLSLTARSGQAGTFSRTSLGTAIDSAGRIRQCVHSQPRFVLVDLDGDGIRETPALLLEDTRTNLCLQSENFGTTWSAVGTPTRVPGADTSAGVTLDLIGDDSAAAVEGYDQPIAFTGNAVKAISVVVAQGTSTSSVIRVLDTTATSDKLIAVVTWSAGLPVIATTVGTSLGFEKLANGRFRLYFATTSVTATNANRVAIYPATTEVLAVANTGTLYAGAVQVEDALFPSSYGKTTTAIFPRSAEALSFAFANAPRALTVYAKFVNFGTQIVTAGAGVVDVGGNGATPRFILYGDSATGWNANHSAVSIAAASAGAAAIGDLVELRGVLKSDGSTQIGVSKNGGAETVGTDATTLTLEAAWNSANLYFNRYNGSSIGFAAFASVRIAAGAQSLAFMRAAS